MGDFFAGFEVNYPVDEVDRQLAIFALAMATGTQFMFKDGKHANGWLNYFIGCCDVDLDKILLSKELLAYMVAGGSQGCTC